MIGIIKTFILVAVLSIVQSLKSFGSRYLRPSQTLLKLTPLELTGQLDPKNSWDVKFILNGEEKTVTIREDTSVLETAEKVFDGVNSSCRNGVCTTCAGKVMAGKENIKLAVHGLGTPQIDAGFVCTCQCYVTGPGVVVKLDAYDEVYESQYGQFELSYGELKYGTRDAPKEEKKKNAFGF